MTAESDSSPKNAAAGAGVENAALLDYLRNRRSVWVNDLREPGPDRPTLEAMLTIAARVPDHKKVAPWRFIVIEGEARARFGERIAEIRAAKEPDISSERLATERKRLTRAPVVVAVVSKPVSHPAAPPEWEQILSAGAACFNLLHAAAAYGFGAQWITEWYAYDERACAAFGLTGGERIAGFIHIGTPPAEKPADRDRPAIADITVYLDGPAG